MSRLDESLKEMQQVEARRSHRLKIWSEIRSERQRQDALHGYQHWPHFRPEAIRTWAVKRNQAISNTERASQDKTLTWEHILYEEITEAFAESDWELRRAELIQCAAVIVAEIEDGDLYHK